MIWVLLALLLLPVDGDAQLKPAPIFSDHMVLQRDEPIHIWGKAGPGHKVSIAFNGVKGSSITAPDSSWSIFLRKQKASTVPRTIIISTPGEKITLHDVLVGDVWIASGQSNMEWPMYREMHWPTESKNTDQPLIRLNNPPPAGRYVYGVAYTDSLNRRLTSDSFYLWHDWKVCDSNSVSGMSAIAYYFAKSIVASENIPIGIINLSIGGAPIETFISKQALSSHRKFANKIKGNWLENPALSEWVRQRGKQNVGSNPNSYGDELGLNHAYKPGFAYNAGVERFTRFPVKGIIWHQGESNSLEKQSVEEYRELLRLLIEDYRAKWKQPALPFYWVQLSSIDTANYKSQLWPQFRDEQRRLLDEVKYGGMAVSSDIGSRNDVHPTNKKDVGERLARWALNKVYKKEIIPSGPLPVDAHYENGNITINFQYANGLTSSDSQPLRGFSLDGKTGVNATITDNKVVIDTNQKPEFIYYAWQPFTRANLINAEKLPASTFKLKVK